MKKSGHRAVHMTFRCDPALEELLARIATEKKSNKSEVLRELVEQGLVATGYKQDQEYLERQIQTAVKTAFQPQVERLAAISAKAAQIAGAAFFMNVYIGQLQLPPSERQLVEEAAAQARKLGIEYLKLKDRDVDAFIESGVEKMND